MAKTGRRANGEGALRERKKNGVTIGWEAAVTFTDLETGLNRRKWLSAKTRREALIRKKAFEQQLEKMGGLPSQERTVAHLLDEWLASVRMRVGLKTMEDYTRIVETRLKPALGEIQLTKLKLVDVEKMARKLVEQGKPNEANRAVARLRMALTYAVERDWVASNVATRHKPVPVPAKDHGIWQPDQVRTFLSFTANQREHAMYTLFLTTGMRSGEVRGLRWKDVDLKRGIIHVRQQWLEAAKASESRFAPPKRDHTRSIHIHQWCGQF
ncbi:site-specific integrase [Deinococcus wulumuqiensis]